MKFKQYNTDTRRDFAANDNDDYEYLLIVAKLEAY